MKDFLLLMHNDLPSGASRPTEEWATYFAKLRAAGVFQGGSSIGGGICSRRSGDSPGITSHLSGYIRVMAVDLEAARDLVAGNPVYEAGGTVEIRELPRDE
ncbi:MAG: hypothetical protein KDC38_02580 [Planctomycetes bacterium]|nr:hypothetical protein [Planctomycetota bacterium]